MTMPIMKMMRMMMMTTTMTMMMMMMMLTPSGLGPWWRVDERATGESSLRFSSHRLHFFLLSPRPRGIEKQAVSATTTKRKEH